MLRNYDTYHTANWYLLNIQFLHFVASQFLTYHNTIIKRSKRYLLRLLTITKVEGLLRLDSPLTKKRTDPSTCSSSTYYFFAINSISINASPQSPVTPTVVLVGYGAEPCTTIFFSSSFLSISASHVTR